MRKRVAGLEASYVESGEGPPVLLIHGFTSSAFTWRHVIPGLASRFRVIAVDLPGFGESDKPADFDYTIPGFARWILAFMDVLDLPRAALVGNSMGGGIAHAVAAMAPDRVTGLVLEDSVGYQPRRERFYAFRLMSVPLLGELLMATMTPLFVRLNFRLTVYHDPALATEEVVDRYLAALRSPGGRAAALRTIRETDFDMASGFPPCRTPALVVWGAQDKIVPVAHAQRFAKDLPQARVEVFDSCGHFPHEERADAFVRLVGDFVAQNASPAAAAGEVRERSFR